MQERVAIIGAGVSGLTCAVVLAELGYPTAVHAAERGAATTSAAAAAIWYPYDTASNDDAILWALATYRELAKLNTRPGTGVSMLELRCFSRSSTIEMPEWAPALGARMLQPKHEKSDELPEPFASGFALRVPLMDASHYLRYLEERFLAAGGAMKSAQRLSRLEEVGSEFELAVNCAGLGATHLVPDPDLEPHRGQIAVVPKLDLPYAIVCDDPPLLYAIPRMNDCVFGGTNEITARRSPDPEATARIVAACSRTLQIAEPPVLAERVGLRPYRKSGVCLRADRLLDGRRVIHNYGHGGAGFTLSWGCAARVAELAALR